MYPIVTSYPFELKLIIKMQAEYRSRLSPKLPLIEKK